MPAWVNTSSCTSYFFMNEMQNMGISSMSSIDACNQQPNSETPPTCTNVDNVSMHVQAPAPGISHLFSI